MRSATLLAGALTLGLLPPAFADEPAQRHGAVQQQSLNLDTGLTWVYATAADPRVGAGTTLSVDFVVTQWFGDNMLTVYTEGATTPPTQAVLNQANGDAGSALDTNLSGRFQVSELHLRENFAWGEVSYGPLIEAASYLDSSAVANDETTQFLAGELVNNTSIQMPDYTVGLALHYHSVQGRPGYTLFFGGSHGLGDNPDHSYSQLFDLGAAGKGGFTALEAYWALAHGRYRVGTWGRSDGGANQGSYLNLDFYRGDWGNFNLRWGQARSEVTDYAALAWEHGLGEGAIGVGYATQTRLGVQAASAELFLRRPIRSGMAITPALQWLHHPDFDPSGVQFDADQTLLALRISQVF